MSKMKTEAMKKLKGKLKCNGDTESNSGVKDTHSEKEETETIQEKKKRWKQSST